MSGRFQVRYVLFVVKLIIWYNNCIRNGNVIATFSNKVRIVNIYVKVFPINQNID